jgi:hypothetical protein
MRFARVGAVALAGLLGLSVYDPPPKNGENSLPGDMPLAGQVRSRGSFKIRGGVAGLFPGATLPVPLTIVNPQQTPITVTALWVRRVRRDHRHPDCPTDLLRTTRFEGSVDVPAEGSVSLSDAVTASLAPSAPDPCQRVRFRLRFAGTAVLG